MDMLAFHFVAIEPFLVEIWQISYLTLKSQDQIWSHLNALSTNSMFAFRFVAIGPFWLRYNKFHIDAENSRSRSRPRSNPMVTFEA